jgi:hypothetical protein
MQPMQRGKGPANIYAWAFGLLVFTMLSGCVSYPMPEDEEEDSQMTIIACFLARCENDLSENKDNENNKGKHDERDGTSSGISGR